MCSVHGGHDVTLDNQIAALQDMATAELCALFEDLHGRKPRYRSVPWLRKRIAFKLQENAFGGLPAPARAELERLAAEVHLPGANRTRGERDDDARGPQGRPRPGTVLHREWHGQQIRVEVAADGFVWNGTRYGSLSAVAFAITGAKWNGRLFFGLTGRTKA